MYLRSILVGISMTLAVYPALAEEAVLLSARSGVWSAGDTWQGGKVPSAGARVLIQTGHAVEYDVDSDQAIRGLNVAGKLSFATDKNTRLDVGLLKIQSTTEYSEDGFDCDEHQETGDHKQSQAALEIGTQDKPIKAGHRALVRLVYFEGMDRNSCPAIVCCGGRLDLHGASLEKTWVKLGEPSHPGDTVVTTKEAVGDWRVGDRIIISATTRQSKQKKTFTPSVRGNAQTEERVLTAIDGDKLTLDRPLIFEHVAEGEYRADVANLSRNVVIESAEPAGVRGHTMYHRPSAGSIGYVEFRHLGKAGVLGRYSLHFHLAGDTMRGSSVIGASIWDSDNRWLTVHGTNYLVVRDCVGYQSVGHGFFLEDGTEVFNVFDHNLAVQAFSSKPLPKQVLPYDKNDGSGFWWANSCNTFTRNTACECDEYGYFFQAPKTADFNPVLPVADVDGTIRNVDIRTLPFVKFENNEAHCQRRHSFNLGGGVPFGEPSVGGVGPDIQHPFVIKGLKLWNVHWGLHPVSPSVVLDQVQIHNSEYGIWRPVYKHHVYRDLLLTDVPDKLHYAFVDGPPPPDELLDPAKIIDDQPPVSVITHVLPQPNGKLLVRGTSSDNGVIRRMQVNGVEAKPLLPGLTQWQVILDPPTGQPDHITAHAEDASGNIEHRPHVVTNDKTPARANVGR